MKFGTFLENNSPSYEGSIFKYVGVKRLNNVSEFNLRYRYIQYCKGQSYIINSYSSPEELLQKKGWAVQPKKNINKEEWLEGYKEGMHANTHPSVRMMTEDSENTRKALRDNLSKANTDYYKGYLYARLANNAVFKHYQENGL